VERIQKKAKNNKDYLEKIEIFARHGITEKEIPGLLGINKAAYGKIMNRNPELSKKMKYAAKLADLKIEEALFRRATGYLSTEEQDIYLPKDGSDIEFNFKERRIVKKFVPPDPASVQVWLYNRIKGKWSKNPEAANDLSSEELSILKDITAEAALQNM
jgi:transcriptional regulator with XRE-family HTH domain